MGRRQDLARAGPRPGYEGWTDNTDPVGAFDPWGNFYSLILPYEFVYYEVWRARLQQRLEAGKPGPAAGGDLGRRAPGRAGRPAIGANWITTHDGHPDFVFTVPNADTNTPDKQWIAIDTNPLSPHYGRVYAMFTQFVLNPSRILVSYARRASGRYAHGLVGAAGAADDPGPSV